MRLFALIDGYGRHDFSKRAVWQRELANSVDIQCNQQPVKPARNVRIGDILQIRTERDEFEVEVLLLTELVACVDRADPLSRNRI